jgi:hypothetical protein
MGTFGSAGAVWERRDEVERERRVVYREHGVELNSDKTEVDLILSKYSKGNK